jgi:Phosphatidylinositol-4-phosphate 5-Kinase.
MQNIFFERNVSKVFDLKGSLRGRFAKNLRQNQEKSDNRSNISPSPVPKKRMNGSDSDISSDDEADFPPSRHGSDDEEGGKDEESSPSSTLLDGDFLEFTSGRPLPLTDRAKAAFHMSILNVSQIRDDVANVFITKYSSPHFTGYALPLYNKRVRLLNPSWY